MEISKQCESGQIIRYEESFLTGKRKLFVDGTECTKLSKKEFRLEGAEGYTDYTIQGNFLRGVTLQTSKGEEIVLAKNKWYDWILIFFPCIGIVFGVAFCGALGGFLSALFCLGGGVVNASVSRTKLALPLRILVQVVVAVVANGLWLAIYFPVAIFILSALS